MKLTQEQINYLFSFCAEQGIIHYDVQIEMVDHFTEWIETNWEKQPYASFLFMIAQLREAFPKTDLQLIVKTKEAALKTELTNLYKKEFLSFFTIPKIALSILLIVLFFVYPFDIKKGKDFLNYITLPYLFVSLYMIYHALRNKNIMKRNYDEIRFSLVIYETFRNLNIKFRLLTGLILISSIILSYAFRSILVPGLIIVIAKVLYPIFIIAFVSYINVSVKINQVIRETYPTAFTS